MPRILIITYYFPPWGMGGVQRVLKFAKYLPEFGWDVTVIAPDARDYHNSDPSLLTELPESVRLERIPGVQGIGPVGPSGPIRPLLRWISSWRDFPDRHRRFAKLASQRAGELMNERSFDVVMTTSPPPSVHVAGLKLRHDAAWIADFRDPWQALVDDYGPTLLHRLQNSALHQRVLKSADAVIAVTPELRQHFEAVCPNGRVCVIRNGYDETDFASQVPQSTREGLRIVIPGTFSRFSDPRPIFRSLAAYRRASQGRLLSVTHVGATIGTDIGRVATKSGLQDIFHDVGYKSHAETLQFMRQADLLMLSYADRRVTDVSVPGRVYEMLRSQRPIIALTPSPGALANLLAPLPACEVISPHDTTAVVSAIEKYLTPEARAPRLLKSIRHLERRSQAEELSRLCQDVVNRKRAK